MMKDEGMKGSQKACIMDFCVFGLKPLAFNLPRVMIETIGTPQIRPKRTLLEETRKSINELMLLSRACSCGLCDDGLEDHGQVHW